MLSALKISKNSALDVIHTENDTDNGNIFHYFHILYLKELIMKEAFFGSSRQQFKYVEA